VSLTVTHTAVATAADDPSAEINKDEWNATHTVTPPTLAEVLAEGNDPNGTAIAGANGGAAAAGGSVTLAGGTGNDGADAGAVVVLIGGDGLSNGGGLTINAGAGGAGGEGAEAILSGSDSNGVGGGFQFNGGAGAAGQAGGAVSFKGGDGDDEETNGARVTVYGGGAEDSGKVEISTGGSTGEAGQVLTADGNSFATWATLKAAYVDPGTGSAADVINALIAAGLMAAS
jgi:hypothetical protein